MSIDGRIDGLLLAALADGPASAAGLRRGWAEPVRGGGDRRRRHRLTAAGARALASWRERTSAPHVLLRRPLLRWLAVVAASRCVPASAPALRRRSALRSVLRPSGADPFAERERRHRAVEAAALVELAALAGLSSRSLPRSSASR